MDPTPEPPAQRGPGVPEIRFQRRAEQIAGVLRERILNGELGEGDLLPKESQLREMFPVSKPTVREALRILESEGLLTVQRGNVGGAIIHRPSPDNVAYSMALVLASRQVRMSDVARALGELEPAGAALCALRDDRHTEVLPALRTSHRQAMEAIDDVTVLAYRSQTFHRQLIDLCGSETLATVATAAEAVWSTHTHGYRSVEPVTDHHVTNRRRGIEAHEQIIDLIDDGDAEGVRRLTHSHLAMVHSHMLEFAPAAIDPQAVRDHLQRVSQQADSGTLPGVPNDPPA